MTRTPSTVDDHPNAAEITDVLARVGLLTDAELAGLAGAWRNTSAVAEARRRALGPDSPLVIDVLAAFDALGALYADDLTGARAWLVNSPAVAATGLRAARDAVAAAYARPVLGRSSYQALMAAWRQVIVAAETPDLGPGAAAVRSLAQRLTALADRCHNPARLADWEALELAGMLLDSEVHAAAVDQAWAVAIQTGRRRAWLLVARSVSEGVGRSCPRCRRRTNVSDAPVLRLGRDAACALVVADQLDSDLRRVLLAPVGDLLPAGPPLR